MKPYVEFEYRRNFGITIKGCEGDPLDPATVRQYAELGNESARAALASLGLAPLLRLLDRWADATDEVRAARYAYRITRSPLAWGRVLRATVDYRLAIRAIRAALHSPPLRRPS